MGVGSLDGVVVLTVCSVGRGKDGTTEMSCLHSFRFWRKLLLALMSLL